MRSNDPCVALRVSQQPIGASSRVHERTLQRMQALLGNPSVDAGLLARQRGASREFAALHPDNDNPPLVRAEKLFWKRLSLALRSEVANGKSERGRRATPRDDARRTGRAAVVAGADARARATYRAWQPW